MPALADLAAFSEDAAGQRLVHVVVETSRGGRNKLAYDPELGVFKLKKVLPEGMCFPCDFGFVPSTRGGDGDPLDALILMDEPGVTGCLVTCRLIGALLSAQGQAGKTVRNDRLVTVAVPSHRYGRVERIDDLGDPFLSQVESFFTSYHAQYGTPYHVLGREGPDGAWRLVTAGLRSTR